MNLRQVDAANAKRMLDHFDKNCESPTDEQKEARDKLEWAINNAHRLKVIFGGMIDQVSINEVEHWRMTLAAKFQHDDSPSKMIH